MNGIGLVNFEPYELRRFAEYALNNRRGAVIGRVYLRLGVWGFLVDGQGNYSLEDQGSGCAG